MSRMQPIRLLASVSHLDSRPLVAEPLDPAARRRECRQALVRDPALWVWLAVAGLALFPLGAALARL